MTQNFNPVIHIHPTDAAPVKTSLQESTKRGLLPQFKYAGMKERFVFISSSANLGVRKPSVAEEDEVGFRALIFKFENESSERAMDVVAKLHFAPLTVLPKP